MSPKRQVNHNIRKHFNTIIYNISRYAEIALSMVILLVIALAGFRLIMEVADTSIMSMDTEFFSTFLSQALSLVVGVEFVKMLCQHSAQTVVSHSTSDGSRTPRASRNSSWRTQYRSSVCDPQISYDRQR